VGHDAVFFLDFISPYTWLALERAEAFAREHAVRWEIAPVVYGAILTARGLVGPVETPDKRRYTFMDVARSAARARVPFAGPPAHPFRSLDALRVMTLFANEPVAARLARALSHAAWSDGRDLTDAGVLSDVVGACGLDAKGLEQRIAAPAVKDALRASTERALAAGVFGVPTFLWNGELFWGHDRMDQLADRIAGRLPDPAPLAAAALARPIGVMRKP